MNIRQPHIEALAEGIGWPDPAESIEQIETHCSWVFLVGEHAWKFKKPVDLGFLDFTTLAARKKACEEELRLNRRLAPELYLDVAPITGDPEQPTLGGEEEPFDYAVKMVRFDRNQELDRLANEGKLTEEMLDTFATQLVAFHREVPSSGPCSDLGHPDRVIDPVEACFVQLRKDIRDPTFLQNMEAVRDWVYSFHEEHFRTFAHRKTDGHIRECHGDLHLGNMVRLDQRIVPFDCLEFSERLRWIDTISEIAFLTMDLVDRGHPELATTFLDTYLAWSGDYKGLELLRWYQVYRAMVRAKVAGIRCGQVGDDDPTWTEHFTEASNYLQQARLFTRKGHPMLFIMCGLSGSGKSTAARELVRQADAIRVRTDVERKRLHGLAPLETSTGKDIYSPEATSQTYERVFDLIRRILSFGFPVIADGTFLHASQREPLVQICRDFDIPFRVVVLDPPVDVLHDRLAARGNDPSEAVPEILIQQNARFERPDPETPEVVIIRGNCVDGITELMDTVTGLSGRVSDSGPRGSNP